MNFSARIVLAFIAGLLLASVSCKAEDIAIPPDLNYPGATYFGHWVAYGERYAMDAKVTKTSALDTDHASIIVVPSERQAIRRCVGPPGADEELLTVECIARELNYAPKKTVLNADCVRGEFDVLWPNGNGKMQFLGIGPDKSYYFKDNAGSPYFTDPEYPEVTSYDMVLTAYRALCPASGKKHRLSKIQVDAIKLQIKKANE